MRLLNVQRHISLRRRGSKEPHIFSLPRRTPKNSHIAPESRVLEIGCGTLRVGLHFIQYLKPEHFHCLERDELSLMAALRFYIRFDIC
nr:S-adenosyl-L-methionine-dependent methyltransferases superfamily protein [Tanacetum cinerariifolium]